MDPWMKLDANLFQISLFWLSALVRTNSNFEVPADVAQLRHEWYWCFWQQTDKPHSHSELLTARSPLVCISNFFLREYSFPLKTWFRLRWATSQATKRQRAGSMNYKWSVQKLNWLEEPGKLSTHFSLTKNVEKRPPQETNTRVSKGANQCFVLGSGWTRREKPTQAHNAKNWLPHTFVT
jgi:hypothetical protein